jgi:hypothetical protein
MSLSSGSYESDGVAERRAESVERESRRPTAGAAELVAEAEVAPADVREPQEGTGGGVSGSVEASRRRGAFDSRWPKRLRLVATQPDG